MALVRTLKDLRFRLFYALVSTKGISTMTLGGSAKWTICPKLLDSESVIYCAGVGHDISFEKQLSETFGCAVHLFDPSPTGTATMSRPENRYPALFYQRLGLADADREYLFDAPAENAEGSFSKAAAKEDLKSTCSFPCCTLQTLMRVHGHSHIDLLKMDIEGFEYGVLEQICRQQIPVRQICVEFHHSLIPEIARSQTIRSILDLRRAGYRLIHRHDWDHTFLRE